MAQAPRPSLVPARTQTREESDLDRLLKRPVGFDADAWHVMNERDNTLIEDEILSGSSSTRFVYNFQMDGTNVIGVSVVGARHLASQYGGLKHRIISSTRKNGALFVFTSYPTGDTKMDAVAKVIRELEDEEDFYSVVVEVEDIKMGNSIQMEAREAIFGQRRGGQGKFLRAHHDKIAQAKAYRNCITALLPQDLQIRWKEQQLANSELITESVIDQKRDGILAYAAKRAVPIDRHQVENLTLKQIAGLADAAREENLAGFVNAARALGLVDVADEGDGGAQPVSERKPADQKKPAETKAPDKAAGDKGGSNKAAAGGPPPEQAGDPGPTSGPEAAKSDTKAADDAKPAAENKPATENKSAVEQSKPEGQVTVAGRLGGGRRGAGKLGDM